MANYKMTSNGSCEPTNSIALLGFKAVQMQTNRFLDAGGKTLLSCDGKLGAKTLAAVNSIGDMFPVTGVLGTRASSCKTIADNAQAYLLALESVANQHNLALPECPKGILRSITNPQPTVRPNGSVVYPSVAQSGIGGVPYWLLAVIGISGYAYYKKTQKKGSK